MIRRGEIPILFNNKRECCGCSACYAICPVRAIEMKLDETGFLYPYIYAEKCLRCNKCVNVCEFMPT
ncbi:4Fe-4S dicluster domain-containing protein [Butyrivibrio fibrisolvens]|uniref:4Fe-4S dicluster domain-containing protein n=1 Tax=Butyrivibrio fibrisolvens TaxID=831 RepID=UPI0009B755BF